MPTHARRTNEAEKGDSGIGREFLGEFALLGKEGLHPAVGHPGFLHQRRELLAAERRRLCRFHDDRATRRNRRRNLVHDEIEGMVEGGYRRDDPDGFLDRPCASVLAGPRKTHRNLDTGPGSQQIGGSADPVDGSVRFDQRVRIGLAAFAGDQRGECFALLRDKVSEPAEHGDALMRLEPSLTVLEAGAGCLQLLFEGCLIVALQFGDPGTVECLHDLDHFLPPMSSMELTRTTCRSAHKSPTSIDCFGTLRSFSGCAE